MTAEAIVDQFIKAVTAMDLDAALEMVTDDVEYDNVPISKVFGPEGLRSTLEMFTGMAQGFDWVVHHQVAVGDVVMNERTDKFLMNGKWLELPVMGLFKVRDGKIALWRDYFDMGMFNAQLETAQA